jgi:hypothetical protein
MTSLNEDLEAPLATSGRRGLRRELRRAGVLTAGFALLGVGAVLAALPMIPGGLPALFLGLTLLSTELAWARRLRRKLLRAGGRLLPRRRDRSDDSPA